jgi:hypothetical protein
LLDGAATDARGNGKLLFGHAELQAAISDESMDSHGIRSVAGIEIRSIVQCFCAFSESARKMRRRCRTPGVEQGNPHTVESHAES